MRRIVTAMTARTSQADLLLRAKMCRWTKDGTARDIRIQAGLSQADVGNQCGVTSVAISRWEAGDRVPRGEPALRYARLLDALSRAAAIA